MSQMSTVSSTATPKARVPLFTAEAWAPLKVQLFRSLWIATTIAQIGTWAREAAGPSLMQSLAHNWPNRPDMVAKVLVYSNLPICLFSVIAGGLADVLDRRRLLIVTQIWMVIISAILGLLSILGVITPWSLLGLTFLLGTGTAAFGPALQAVLPELVPPKHFSLAINMNSIALNLARAVGPALFVVVVWLVPGNETGDLRHDRSAAGFAYLLTAASFVGAAWVLWRWKRAPQRAAVHGEDMWNGIHAGFIYTIHSPANRAILLRVLTFIVPAVVMWSQVPIIATDQLHMQASAAAVTALLFTFVGCGAIFGVFLMPGLHGRYDIDPVVNVCTACFALGLVALSYVHSLWLAAIVLIFLGVNWVIIPTNFNTATQKSVPPWVKGRAISFYLTVLFGSFALGGELWGKVTTHSSIHTSLFFSGVSMLCLLVLAIWFPLTLNAGKDMSPAHSGPPSEDLLGPRPAASSGAIQIRIRYEVPPHRKEGLTDLLRDLRAMRKRNGLKHWQLETADLSGRSSLVEVLTYSSWDAYTRTFSRKTKWDVMLESLTQEYRVGSEGPVVVTGGFPVIASTKPALQVRPRGNGQRLSASENVSRTLDRLIDELFVSYDRLNRPPR
ncbi:MAG TPA: MFS transporter [Tepidisphaeraceae bacterium]|jgi:MFS family permease|nr:MFS transporter [Tepidisphaeraceae bacterium]